METKRKGAGERSASESGRYTGLPKETVASRLGPRSEVRFGREICGTLESAEKREWLVTNGLGGYASGTVSGNLTRRYHGLLVAALRPPLGRTLLVAKLEETARYDGSDYLLSTNRWASGAVEPQGHLLVESFHLEGTAPVWQFALGEAGLEKRIWMRGGENTTFVQYRVTRGSIPLRLAVKALVNYRDFHASTHAGDWRMQIASVEGGIRIQAFKGAAPFYLLSAEAQLAPEHEWYHDYFLPEEQARGLDDKEDHLLAAGGSVDLVPGASVTFVLTTHRETEPDGTRAWHEHTEYEGELLARWQERDDQAASAAPGWVRQLILAADQFVVKRSLPEGADGPSILAGYHWFGDWGRDTMIALPGLTLTAGRPEIAKKILFAFSRYVDAGMLPNNLPEASGKPEYNTVDAALWYFEAVRQYFESTKDAETVATLYPVLTQIIQAHLRGTRYHIHVDERDGLLYAGEDGVQLTWMDAKVDDWVVTPRVGKAVEINALWYNALKTMAALATVIGSSGEPFQQSAETVRTSFVKFWNARAHCCFDVIEDPRFGNDASLRPNQIFAVSLPESPLTPEQQKAVVDVCARSLLTSVGLRSLAPGEPGYQGHYGGSPRERDAAYHQGTVWGWLLGPFALAHRRVYGDSKTAQNFLEVLGRQLGSYGLGTLGEIFDGDAPFPPRGCIAQAWTVAEVLRAWRACLK